MQRSRCRGVSRSSSAARGRQRDDDLLRQRQAAAAMTLLSGGVNVAPGATRMPTTLPRRVSSMVPEQTTVRVADYERIDPQFASTESRDYWSSVGPDVRFPMSPHRDSAS